MNTFIPTKHHCAPQYYNYYRTHRRVFWEVSQCTNPECLLVGLAEDVMIYALCPRCGGEVKKAGAAKWVEEPTGRFRTKFFGLIKTPIMGGRWVPAQAPKTNS